jgi:putative ABC transport system substrate-binding protein
MRRIGLAVVLALSLTSPLLTIAQQEGKVIRIGILGNVPVTDAQGSRLWGGFIQELRTLGYIEGRNLKIEHRSSEGRYERLPELAAELVRLRVDVIVVGGDQNALVAKQATDTIPIVMAAVNDAVSSGLVASLAHPAGNVTGLSFLVPEITGKQLELLKEMVPRISRVAIFWNPGNPSTATVLRVGTVAAQSLGVQVQPMPVRGLDELEKAFATMNREHIEALLVPADGMMLFHRKRIVNLAAKSRLPAMYGLTEYVEAGGLAVYSPSLYDLFPRAAVYVDKILKGTKPADLPVEQPTKFELVINLKTAKALGLTIPQTLLLRADQLIE